MSFFSNLAEETGARRLRMRKAIGDRGASALEFFWLLGLTMSAMRGLVRLEHWQLGFLPFAAAVLGYVALDARRQSALQRALAAGQDPAPTQRLYGRLSLALLSVLALVGIAVYAHAYYEPPPARIELPAAPPPDARYVDIN